MVLTRSFFSNFHFFSPVHQDSLYSFHRSCLSCLFPQKIFLVPFSPNCLSPLQSVVGSSDSTHTDQRPPWTAKPVHGRPVFPASVAAQWTVALGRHEGATAASAFLFPTSVWSLSLSHAQPLTSLLLQVDIIRMMSPASLTCLTTVSYHLPFLVPSHLSSLLPVVFLTHDSSHLFLSFKPFISLHCFRIQPNLVIMIWGFPAGSDGKNIYLQDLGSIPGLGRSPGKGNGYPLQYSWLENSMDRGAWWATVHGVT